MKTITIEDALGTDYCQNITELSNEKFKKMPLKLGHIVKKEDIKQLLNTGKESLYHYENEEQKVHEDEAALYIARSSIAKDLTLSSCQDGRVDIIAKRRGLLKINLDLLELLNNIPYVRIATGKNMQDVEKGKIIGGTRVLPHTVRENVLAEVNACCEGKEPLFTILPYKKHKVGLIKFGTEKNSQNTVSYIDCIKNKFTNWNSEISYANIITKHVIEIEESMQAALEQKASFIVLVHSLESESAIANIINDFSTEVISYDAPVFPGTHFMLAYRNDIPIIALPHYLLEQKTSAFDLVVPKLLAGLRMTKRDIFALAHGGLCDC